MQAKDYAVVDEHSWVVPLEQNQNEDEEGCQINE